MKESIANRLKTFRLSKKATQKDMASALGCSEITYNRYERETTLPRTEDLSFLYNMGCNLNWLITGEGTMEDEQKSDSALLETINKSGCSPNSSRKDYKNSHCDGQHTCPALFLNICLRFRFRQIGRFFDHQFIFVPVHRISKHPGNHAQHSRANDRDAKQNIQGPKCQRHPIHFSIGKPVRRYEKCRPTPTGKVPFGIPVLPSLPVVSVIAITDK